MSEKIEPALTAEEWMAIGKGKGIYNDSKRFGSELHLSQHKGILYVNWDGAVYDMEPQSLSVEARHAVAAACLNNQPFGFHQKDVDCLRSLSYTEADELASRIEALLPPETDEIGTPKTRREGR